MLFLKRLFSHPKFQAEGRALFAAIGVQARLPILYTAFGVPDTIDGRFEMICLHAYSVFHRLKGHGAETDALSQAIYDSMFEDLDAALRELGVADLGVGRRIKIMTEALNGRIQAYDQGIASGDAAALQDAIRRNVYGCFIDDPFGIQMRHVIGVDRILFESDYPHADSLWPNTRQHATKVFADVPDNEAKMILETNARQLFRFGA